jgi:hypothetical protein
MMKVRVNSKRLCAWGWVIAFLVTLLIAGNDLFGLQGRPLVGLSGETRMVKLKLKQLEDAAWQRSQSVSADINILLANYMPALRGENDALEKGSQRAGELYNEPVRLPALTGIIQKVDYRGRLSYIAAFKSRFCKKNDYIDGFRIGFISPQGVEVMRSGRKWFLACPTAHYSMDAGN